MHVTGCPPSAHPRLPLIGAIALLVALSACGGGEQPDAVDAEGTRAITTRETLPWPPPTTTTVARPEPPPICAEPVWQLATELSFAFDEAEILPEARAALVECAVLVLEHLQNGGQRVSITGSADRVGEADHNQQLSQARADAVKEVLRTAGVPADAMIAVGIGEQGPEDGKHEPQYRRVVVRLS